MRAVATSANGIASAGCPQGILVEPSARPSAPVDRFNFNAACLKLIKINI